MGFYFKKASDFNFHPLEERLYIFLRNYFYIDFRSLAAIRILLGTILLIDISNRIIHFNMHYVDTGFFPRNEYLNEFLIFNGFYMATGHPIGVLFLFLVTYLLALALIVGYRTQIVTFLCWVLTLSLHLRLPIVLQAGDSLLRALLFWSIFLPLGAKWSVDSIRNQKNIQYHDNKFFSMATTCYILQVTYVYLFAICHKFGPAWLQNANAIHYALHNDAFTTRFGFFLRDHFAFLLPTLTRTAYFIEGSILFIFIFPHWLVRLSVFIALCGLHAGIAIFLHVGMFPLISMASILSILPTEFWDYMAKKYGCYLKSRTKVIKKFIIQQLSPKNYFFFYNQALSCLLLVLVMFVFVYNINNTFNPNRLKKLLFFTNRIAEQFGLDQSWDMFAPTPPLADGWFVIEAIDINYNHYQLWERTIKEGVDFQKPKYIASLYYTQRTRKLWENIITDKPKQLENISKYYCQSWIKKRKNKLNEINIYYMEEVSPKPGDLKSDVSLKKYLKHKQKC